MPSRFLLLKETKIGVFVQLRVDPERLSHTFFSRKPLQDASQMLEEALDKLKSLLPASDDHTQRAATIQSMKASKGKPAGAILSLNFKL